jgi:hypothetical protein
MPKGGAGSKNIHRALDASLTRLGVDVIDLYWMHVWGGVTPVEEIVQTLSNLVRAAAQSASGNPSQHADRQHSNRRPEAADMHPGRVPMSGVRAGTRLGPRRQAGPVMLRARPAG